MKNIFNNQLSKISYSITAKAEEPVIYHEHMTERIDLTFGPPRQDIGITGSTKL
jgi:hypothetical protein